jgi:hypothetical protein
MGNITISQKKLLPKRRDKQIDTEGVKQITIQGIGSGTGGLVPAIDYNADAILTMLKTVDGIGSGLDADLLDGQDADAFASKIHNLIDTTNHPVTGLTPGHFLQAFSPTTYGFAAISDNYLLNTGDTATGNYNFANLFYIDDTNNLVKSDILQNQTGSFVTGFAGSGFRLIETGGISTLEVDQLKVRGAMTVYELDINKLNSVNGGMLISPANATVISVVGTTFYIDEDNGHKQFQFTNNDYVRAQIFTGRDVNSYIGIVTARHHDTTYGAAYITCTTVSGTPWAGMELVQFGNSTDATRQSALYLTARETNSPYIAGYAGVNDGTLAGHEKFRVGNLTGITDATFGALSGYGLYADNVYLTGAIKATSGLIAGLTVDADSFYTGTKHATDDWSTTGITIASNGSIHTPNFYVNSDGEIGIRCRNIMLSYVGVSDVVILSHDADAGKATTSYSLAKTITLGSGLKPGRTLRIKFTLVSSSASILAYGRIYRNGVAVGTERSCLNTPTTYSQDITGWSPTDTIQIYLKVGSTGAQSTVSNFRVCGMLAEIVNEVMGTNS